MVVPEALQADPLLQVRHPVGSDVNQAGQQPCGQRRSPWEGRGLTETPGPPSSSGPSPAHKPMSSINSHPEKASLTLRTKAQVDSLLLLAIWGGGGV